MLEYTNNNGESMLLKTWEDVKGMKSQIDFIRKKIELPLKHKDLMSEFGISSIRGILLYGPPGCGKTLIANIIASTYLIYHNENNEKLKEKAKQLGVPTDSLPPGSGKKVNLDEVFFYIKGSEILNKWVGSTEGNIRQLFKETRAATRKYGIRSILFIDEGDALFNKTAQESDNGVRSALPTFLAEMDGFDAKYNPLVILATNKQELLDPALLRPGRLDLHIYIDRPTQEDAEEIFMYYIEDTLVKDAKDLSVRIAEYLYSKEGHEKIVSGALIRGIVRGAIEQAVWNFIEEKQPKEVTYENLTTEVDRVIQTHAELNRDKKPTSIEEFLKQYTS